VENEKTDEQLLFPGYRCHIKINRCLKDAAEFGMLIEHRPDLPVLLGQREEVLDTPYLGIRVNHFAGVDEASDDASALD